jgi:hypothetical protein
MNAKLLTGLITSLRGRARELKDQSERSLILAACSGVAVILSSTIGLTFYYLIGGGAMAAATVLAHGVLLPISLLIGIAIFNGLKKSWVTSGDIFQRLRYLDYEYYDDIKKLHNLSVSNKEKERIAAERFQKYLKETEPFRVQIRNLDLRSQTLLIKDWKD